MNFLKTLGLKSSSEFRVANFLNAAVIAYFIGYALYQTTIFMHTSSFIPDEGAFFNESVRFHLFQRSAPPFNYGSVYWEILHLLGGITAIRLVFLFLFLAAPLLLLSSLENPFQRILGLLLYLSFPAAFWTGKLIGPEILSFFLISLAINLRKNLKYAALCVGLSIGIKITFAPFALYFLLILMLLERISIKGIITFLTYLLIGFYLANPVNLDLYLANIFRETGIYTTSVFTWSNFSHIFLEESWTWDNVLKTSFSNFICHPILLAVFILGICLQSWRMAVALLAFLGISFAMILRSDGYVWYFFSVIPTLIFALSVLHVRRNKDAAIYQSKYCFQIRLVAASLVVFVVLANYYLNINISVRQSYEKWTQIQTLDQFPVACIRQQVRSYQPEHIVVMSEFGKEIYIPEIQTIPISIGYGARFDLNKRSMWMIGSRLIANPYHLDTVIPTDVSFKKLAICNNIFIFVNQ